MDVEIDLYSGAGQVVARVECPPLATPADVLVWGRRVFVHCADGRYVEALALNVWTREEKAEAKRAARRPSE